MPQTPKLVRSMVTPPIGKRRDTIVVSKPPLNVPETTYRPEIHSRHVKQPTVPTPFELPGDYFSQRSKEQFTRLVQQEQEKFKLFQRYKAKQMPTFYTHKQYTPDEEPTIDDQNAAVTPGMFQNSERRAKARQSFEDYMRRKTDILEELRQKELDEKKRKEAFEIKELRRQMVPKICPYSAQKPFVVRPAEKKTTQAQEFALSGFKFKKPDSV